MISNAACILQFALCFNSPLLEHFFERIAGMQNMLPKQIAGGHNVALAA